MFLFFPSSTKISVVMLKDFESLGKEGDVVSVKRGYMRNYLYPRGIALYNTRRNQEKLAEQGGKKEEQEEQEEKEPDYVSYD